MKYLLPFACMAVMIISCKHHEEEHNDSYVQAKVDSIVGSRLGELNRKAMEDLDQRMTIEVKAKADSIIAARKLKAHPPVSPSPTPPTPVKPKMP